MNKIFLWIPTFFTLWHWSLTYFLETLILLQYPQRLPVHFYSILSGMYPILFYRASIL